MANTRTRRDVELQLIEKAWKDDTFRQALRSDPRGTVEKALGAKLPAGLKLKVVEETADTFYLVLPAKPDRVPAGPLTDRLLESVAGGFTAEATQCSCNTCGYTCDDTCAPGCGE
jgi:hypothetical protein